MKVSIIGAGNVGSTLAARILEKDLADVVLLDIAGDLARGKALDLMHSAPILGFQSNCVGTEEYSYIKDSDVVVITAGLTRRPGISREDLLKKNAAMVREISLNIKEYSPESVVIVVTNPLDIMTWLALKASGFEPQKVLGMAGVLDGARFSANIAADLKVPVRSVKSLVLGLHSDNMIPIISHTAVSDANIKKVCSSSQLEGIIHDTKTAGAKIVSLLSSGSAYFAPSAGAFFMVEAIVKGVKRTMAASVYLDGEYGIKGVCLGVPAEIGREGLRKIVEIKLSKEEQRILEESALSLKQKLSEFSG